MFVTSTNQVTGAKLPEDSSDHSSRAPSILATNGLFIACVTVLITLRVYTKVFLSKRLFLDDYLMIMAAAFFLFQAALNLDAVSLGFGKHGWDVPGSTFDHKMQRTESMLKLNFLSLIFVSLAISLGKLSIIATLLHIFTSQTVDHVLRAVLRITRLVVSVCCAIQVLLIIFQCTPVQLSWMVTQLGDGGSCLDLEAALVATCVVNVITDFVICCSPIPSFFRLNMPLRQRVALSSLFLSGLIASIIGVVRVVYTGGLENNGDMTYVTAPYFNWSVAETGLCIITGSIPALRPLLANMLPKLFEEETLNNLAVTVKDGIRRARSRQSSRRRSSSASLRHLKKLSVIQERSVPEDNLDKDTKSTGESTCDAVAMSRSSRVSTQARDVCMNFSSKFSASTEPERGRGRSRPRVVDSELGLERPEGQDSWSHGARQPS